MHIVKLYNKWVYYRHMANKRPVSTFCNTRPSLFLQNYLIYKERAAWLLTSGRAFTSVELAMLHEMAEQHQTSNSNVTVTFYTIN